MESCVFQNQYCSVDDIKMEEEDGQQTMVIKEEILDECDSNLDQKDPELLNIKEDEEKDWISQEEEMFDGQNKSDTSGLFFSAAVKTEDDEEEPQPSQLQQIKTEDNSETEPPSTNSAIQTKTEPGGDCGGPERVGNPAPNGYSESVEVCKTKWKAFRDAFVKHRKRAQHPSGLAGGGIQREYKYAALMDFVVPFLQPRRSNPSLAPANTGDRSNPGTPQSMSGSESDERPSTPVIQPVQPLPSPTPSVSAPTTSDRTERPSRSRSPRRRPQTSRGTSRVKQETARSQSANPDIAGRLMSLLEEPVPKPQMPDEDLDECYHFALSIVPMLYKLDEDGRQEAKINILRTIHNIRKRSQQTTVPQQQT